MVAASEAAGRCRFCIAALNHCVASVSSAIAKCSAIASKLPDSIQSTNAWNSPFWISCITRPMCSSSSTIEARESSLVPSSVPRIAAEMAGRTRLSRMDSHIGACLSKSGSTLPRGTLYTPTVHQNCNNRHSAFCVSSEFPDVLMFHICEKLSHTFSRTISELLL